MTFQDFAMECEMYPHSNEHFALVKECSELRLEEMFIENQRFVNEHAESIKSSGVTLSKDYFRESVADDQLEAMMEEVQTKAANIWKKICNGLKKIIRTIKTFFQKMINSMDDTGKGAANALAALRKITLTKDDVDALNGVIADVNANDEDNPPARRSRPQPFVSELKLKYDAKAFASKAEKRAFEDKIAVALSTTTVCLNGGGRSGAVPAEDLVAACKKLVAAKKGYQASDVTAMIDGAVADANKNGLVLNANTPALQKLVNQLDELEKQITSMAENNAPAEGQDGEAVTALNSAYAKINGCISATMTVYTKYLNHRKKASVQIAAWCNSHSKSAPAAEGAE